MMVLLQIALALAGLPVALAAGYLATLALLSRRPPARAHGIGARRFDLVVPAHDEEAGIAATVRCLLAVDWPAAQRRVVVVADNCGDATAARARAAGATVLERRDVERRGKGYALVHAFEWCLADGFADALVVIDADTLASPGLLRAFSARLDEGAGALQARYGVRNPAASWRARLMSIAFTLFHDVRSLGRERLGLSAGLRGNGMCFSARLLRQAPYRAFSVTEDLEYGIQLGLAGHRVHYVDEVAVVGEMPTGSAASATQRRRWEGGRAALARRDASRLLRIGLRDGDRVLIDLAFDLLVPPLTTLVAVALAGSMAALVLALLAGSIPAGAWGWWGGLVALAGYVGRGWWLSGMGLTGLACLARAPLFMNWKAGLAVSATTSSSAPMEWERTPREPTP